MPKITVNDRTWVAVEALLDAAAQGDLDAIEASAQDAVGLPADECRGVRATLSRTLFHCIAEATEGQVSYETVHHVARSAHPRVVAIVRLDLVELEHLLRAPFGKSEWPSQELDSEAYAGLASIAICAIRSDGQPSVRERFGAQIEQWLVEGTN